MKSLQVLVVVLVLVFVATTCAAVSGLKDHGDHDQHDEDDDDDKNEDNGKRLCPDGYTYAGDDSPHRVRQDYGMEEIDRSPVYSCYKVVRSFESWMSANLNCIDDDAQLASFEDFAEMKKFRKTFYDDNEDFTVELLTSAIHFGSDQESGWVWIGSNATLEPEVLNFENSDNETELEEQCLVLHIESNNKSSTYLKPVNCIQRQSSYVCEARVQTVTYYAWFMANWFTFLLIFLLVVLVLSLCISMTMYSKKTNRRERVYRGQSRQMSSDLPPSYHETTGAVGVQESRLNQYRNKGKDLLAKVYLYKEEKKVAPRH